MYTNNETNILNEVRGHLEKGNVNFELDFAERTFDQLMIDEILGGFCGVSLPDHLKLDLNLSTTNVEDDLIIDLAAKLSEINWPNKFTLNLSLRNNSIIEEGANILLDLFEKFEKFPEAEVIIDLDNNNSLDYSVIDDALNKIKKSRIIKNAIVSEDKKKTIKFCNYIVEDYLKAKSET